MKMKKIILVIMTLVFMILPMMTISSQAITVGTVYNLESQTNGNTVNFEWSSVTNADGYDLYVNTANKGFEYIGSVNTNSCSVIGFQSGVKYAAKVCAYQISSNGTKQVGGYSNIVNINQNITIQNDLDKVKSLTATQNGGNVTLNWSSVSNATGYQVYVNIPDLGYVNVGSVEGSSTTQAIIIGFTNGKTYDFKVRAYKKASSGNLSYGDFSPERTLKINNNQYDEDNNYKPEETKPGTIKNLRASEIYEDEAVIRWNASSNTDGYEVWVAEENGRFYYINTVYKNYTTLKYLEEGTDYEVKILPFREGSKGIVYGEPAYESFTTKQEQKKPAQVKNVTTGVSGNEVGVDWSKVTGAKGYNVYLSKNNTSNFKYQKTTTTNSTLLKNLDYDTTYYVRVAAYTYINGKEVEGTVSAYKQFKTKADTSKTIGNVTHLNATVKNRNEAYLTWWDADNAYGYDIYLAKGYSSLQKIDSTTKSYYTIYSYDLDYNTTYRVQVRPYGYINGKKTYGAYSSIISFKTEKASTTEGNSNVPRVQNVKANVVKDTVYLTWDKVPNAVKYEIDFTVPGIGGSTKFTVYTNSREISGLTDKTYKYTARVRAYKYVNGKLVPGDYSKISEFSGK